MNPNDKALNSPTSMVVTPQDQQQTGFLISPSQILPGTITPPMLAATPVLANGDQYYSNGTTFVRLPIGTANQVLTTTNGIPAWQTLSIPTVPTDGWTTIADTLVYASASSVTIAGVDRTTIYKKGTRVKFTNNSTTFYGVVASSSFSTDTTITFLVTSDFSVANSAITSPFYSYQLTPQGYPTWFNFATTHAGFSANPTYTMQYRVDGDSLTINYNAIYNPGTSNATSYTITMPAATLQAEITSIMWKDNSSYGTVPGSAYAPTSATLQFFTSIAQAGWTNSGTKSAVFNGFTFKY